MCLLCVCSVTKGKLAEILVKCHRYIKSKCEINLVCSYNSCVLMCMRTFRFTLLDAQDGIFIAHRIFFHKAHEELNYFQNYFVKRNLFVCSKNLIRTFLLHSSVRIPSMFWISDVVLCIYKNIYSNYRRSQMIRRIYARRYNAVLYMKFCWQRVDACNVYTWNILHIKLKTLKIFPLK